MRLLNRNARESLSLAIVTCAVVVTSAIVAPARADKGPGRSVIKQTLTSTGVDAEARGRARLIVRNDSDGTFRIDVRNLDRNATFEIIVGGVKVGTLTTTGGGNGHTRFRTRPRGHDSVLGFDPRGQEILIRNGDGVDVLAQTISDGGGSLDSGDIACCVPDDGGTECEDRTPAECEAEGGIATQAGSCLPNPCVDAPPGGQDIVCCIPDDSGAECEDRTQAECVAEGGTVVAATSCTPNPCSGTTPSPDADIQCCLPDDSGFECEDRTVAECSAQGGVNVGSGVCTAAACQGVQPPPAGSGTARVRCERRSNRSKISVDGNNLAAGSYQARVTSGGNTATAPGQSTVGDEVEFDFDSESDDIAAGATAISASFIQGTPPQVTGQILDGTGAVVTEATVTCLETSSGGGGGGGGNSGPH